MPDNKQGCALVGIAIKNTKAATYTNAAVERPEADRECFSICFKRFSNLDFVLSNLLYN